MIMLKAADMHVHSTDKYPANRVLFWLSYLNAIITKGLYGPFKFDLIQVEIIENLTNATLTFCTILPTNYRALTTFQLDRQSYGKLQLPQDYNTIRTLHFALIYVVRKLRGIPVMPLEPQRHAHAYIVVRHLKLVNTKFSSHTIPSPPLPSLSQDYHQLGRSMLNWQLVYAVDWCYAIT